MSYFSVVNTVWCFIFCVSETNVVCYPCYDNLCVVSCVIHSVIWLCLLINTYCGDCIVVFQPYCGALNVVCDLRLGDYGDV